MIPHPVHRARAVPARAMTATSALTVAVLMVGLAAVAPDRTDAADSSRLSLLAAVDITDTTGTISAQHSSPTAAEDINKVIDNTPYRKYFTSNSTGWIQFTARTAAVATSYALISANDAPERNPRSWTFEASADGNNWTGLDTQTDQTFVAGFQRKEYGVGNTTAYRYYRLSVTANNGSPDLQLGEWQILGTTSDVPPTPAAPTAPTGTPMVVARSRDHLELNWIDNTRFETAYELQRRVGSANFATVATLPPGTTRYVDLGLAPGTTYDYRVRAKGTGTAASGWLPGRGRPLSIAQHASMAERLHGVPGYNETVTHFATAGTVAAYRTSSLNGTDLAWAVDYVRRIWEYSQRTYGGLANQQLYAVFHPGGGGGTARVLFDQDSFYRNMVDMEAGVPPVSSFHRRNIFAHEIGHVVEGSAHGVHGSPAGALWRDSKWCEIFQYDAYLGAGFTADAADWKKLLEDQRPDDFPKPETRWFVDWFLELYEGYPGHQYRGSDVLKRFFQLLATHFHKFNGAYQRDLNWGEFVHFWSGAAGVNLQPQAAIAFDWSPERTAELDQARRDFSLNYAF